MRVSAILRINPLLRYVSTELVEHVARACSFVFATCQRKCLLAMSNTQIFIRSSAISEEIACEVKHESLQRSHKIIWPHTHYVPIPLNLNSWRWCCMPHATIDMAIRFGKLKLNARKNQKLIAVGASRKQSNLSHTRNNRLVR